MKLSEFGAVAPQAKIVFVGKLEKDLAIVSAEGIPYYKGMLKDPIMVGCSIDKEIEQHEADFLYIREEDALGDKWVFVNGKDATDGFYIPDFVADFSKGHEADLYQSTTIRQWTRDTRTLRGKERTATINDGLHKRMQERRAKLGLEDKEKSKGKGK